MSDGRDQWSEFLSTPLDVLAAGVPVPIGDRSGAGRTEVGRHVACRDRAGLPGRVQLRELQEIGRQEGLGFSLEAVEAVLHVIHKADLALLAVADDVDAGGNLFSDRLADGAPDPCGEGRRRWPSVRRSYQHAGEVAWSWKAARVGRQDASLAALHLSPPLVPLASHSVAVNARNGHVYVPVSGQGIFVVAPVP